MKRIVFVIETLSGGGAERVTAALANEFCKDKNKQIHIITYAEDDKDYFVDKRIIKHGIGDVSSNFKFQRVFNRIYRMRNLIQEINPYCVISLGSPIIVFPLVIAMLRSGYPLILSERNDPSRFPTSKLRRFIRNLCYLYCDGIVFQTTEAKKYFSKIIQKKGIVICNPITSGIPEPYLGNRDLRIVNFCRLTPQKNLDLLIDAFSDISGEFDEYSLHIYGDGEERERLQTKINNMGMSNRIYLHNYSKNIYEQIKTASLFVSSSNYEGISNSMLEAIALGIPTICTDCPSGGARETIRDGINGLLVPVGDRAQMRMAIKKVLSNKTLAHTLSNNGIGLRSVISVDEVSRKWENAIELFLNK